MRDWDLEGGPLARIERSLADLEYESKRCKTRREKFLERMEVLVPWEKLLEKIRPYYPTAGKGRVPYPLEPFCGCIVPTLLQRQRSGYGGHALQAGERAPL